MLMTFSKLMMFNNEQVCSIFDNLHILVLFPILLFKSL